MKIFKKCYLGELYVYDMILYDILYIVLYSIQCNNYLIYKYVIVLCFNLSVN